VIDLDAIYHQVAKKSRLGGSRRTPKGKTSLPLSSAKPRS